MLETTFYFGYWFIILCVMAYKGWQGSLFDADFKFKQEQKKLEAKRAKEEAALLNADGEQPLALTDSAHTGEIAGVVCADSIKVAEEVEVATESDAGLTPIAPRRWWRRVLPSKQ